MKKEREIERERGIKCREVGLRNKMSLSHTHLICTIQRKVDK